MSVQTELTRISNARNTLRTKGVGLGIALATDNITDIATKFNSIADRGTPNAEVREGETYTINPGYYHGGTVQGVAGGGSYNLQSKTVTPTKSSQSITPDTGYYGLNSVSVNPIPDIYQDVSDVTAEASDVLSGKIIVESDGTVTTGTMLNRGAVTTSLDCGDTYTIPTGYHNGSGVITANSLASQTGVSSGSAATAASILNGKEAWVEGVKITGTMPVVNNTSTTIGPGASISYTTGYRANEWTVSVGSLASYTGVDSGKTAIDASHVVIGYQGWVNGNKVTGSMANNGSVTATLTGLGSVAGDTSYTIPAGYHDGTGTVSITSAIETALSYI